MLKLVAGRQAAVAGQEEEVQFSKAVAVPEAECVPGEQGRSVTPGL
jgi:hypothetical protein